MSSKVFPKKYELQKNCLKYKLIFQLALPLRKLLKSTSFQIYTLTVIYAPINSLNKAQPQAKPFQKCLQCSAMRQITDQETKQVSQ